MDGRFLSRAGVAALSGIPHPRDQRGKARILVKALPVRQGQYRPGTSASCVADLSTRHPGPSGAQPKLQRFVTELDLSPALNSVSSDVETVHCLLRKQIKPPRHCGRPGDSLDSFVHSVIHRNGGKDRGCSWRVIPLPAQEVEGEDVPVEWR